VAQFTNPRDEKHLKNPHFNVEFVLLIQFCKDFSTVICVFSFRSLLIICLFSSALIAQDNGGVNVSPQILAQNEVKDCKALTLGKTAFSAPPKYPNEAMSAKVGGTVSVKISINKQGEVEKVIEVSGPELLADSASTAAKNIRFTPTVCDGKPVATNGLVVYHYKPFVFTDSYYSPKKVEEFSDISRESNYYEPILNLTENYNLAFGFVDKKFHPNAPLTKGEFAHFLRMTLDFLRNRAKLANKIPKEIGLYSSYNPQQIKTIDEISDINYQRPYSESVSFLVTKYDISLTDEENKFAGKLPLTHNEVIDYWSKIFGEDAVPVNFEKIPDGDRIFTRGEFALFLQESLYVLTYKVLP